MYLPVLQQGFDSLQQLLDAYVDGQTLDSAIFEDLGVEDSNHCHLFASWFEKEKGTVLVDLAVASKPLPADRSTDLKTLHFSEWLQQVDPAGALDGYATLLEESFDSVHQVVELYADDNVLDPDFFADLGINNEKHQSLFDAWFVEMQGTSLSTMDCQEPENFLQNGTSSAKHSVSKGSFQAATGARHSKVAGFKGSFEDWLQEVDPEGALARYGPGLSEAFNSVQEMVETYIVSGGAFDRQFFTYFSVDHPDHRQLFEDWFAEQTDFQSSPKFKTASTSAFPSTKKNPFSAWLNEVDASGNNGLAQYLDVVEDNFDTVKQISELYSRSDELVMQFFEDVGVTRPAHQNLFRNWFHSQRSQEAGAGAQAMLQAGARVRVKGLKQRPELNGKVGTLHSFMEEEGRWKVRLEDGSGRKLKPENIGLA